MFNYIKSLILRALAKFAVDYNGSMRLLSNNMTPNFNGVTVASAATITLDYAFTLVSGTTNVTAVKVPTGFRGIIGIIPTGALPFVSGGTYVASDGTYETLPVKVSKTCAANVPCVLFCDGSFVYPLLSA